MAETDDLDGWRPAPKAASILLEPGMPYERPGRSTGTALGTGIIGPIIGSARSGKTFMALTLIDWACRKTERSIFFLGMPECFLDELPPHIRERASTPALSEVSRLRDGIVFLDDAPSRINARESASKGGRLIHKLSGVISHLGLAMVVCTQSTAGIDIGLMRFCEMAPLIKRMDGMALQMERTEWKGVIERGQREIGMRGGGRSLYWSVADKRICRHPAPSWIVGNDVISRPFRYLSRDEFDTHIGAD